MTIPQPNIQILCVLDPDTEKCHFLRVEVTEKYLAMSEEEMREARCNIADTICDGGASNGTCTIQRIANKDNIINHEGTFIL